MAPRPARLFVLGALYVAQGLPFGFFNQAIPVLLRQGGASLTLVSFSSVLAVPWALKFLWAPLFDRPALRSGPGRRRSILAVQAASVALLVGVAAVDPGTALPWVMLGVFLANLLCATQDIATDGLAVDVLAESERGVANGVQVGGYRVGMVAGGGALLVALEAWGWSATVLALAGLLALASAPLLVAGPLPAAAARAAPEAPSRLADWLGTRSARDWLALLLLYKAGDAFGTGVVKPMLVDQGLGLADVGWLFGTLGSVAAVVGALTGGALAGRWGARRVLPGFALLQAGAVGGWGLVAWAPTPAGWTVATVFEHLVSGMATAALFAAMMAQCRPGRSASDYTLQASVVVLAQGFAAAMSGPSAQLLGYVPHQAVGFVWALFAVGAASRAPAAVWAPAEGGEQRRE